MYKRAVRGYARVSAPPTLLSPRREEDQLRVKVPAGLRVVEITCWKVSCLEALGDEAEREEGIGVREVFDPC